MSTSPLSNTIFNLVSRRALPLSFTTFSLFGYTFSLLDQINQLPTKHIKMHLRASVIGLSIAALAPVYAYGYKSLSLLAVGGVGLAGAFWAIRQIQVINKPHSDPDTKSKIEMSTKWAMLAMGMMVVVPCYNLLIDARQGRFNLRDRKSTRLNSSHIQKSRMPSSA